MSSLFQTLIGTVKSLRWPRWVYQAKKFQTLIGTVKSPDGLEGEHRVPLFQTLIGTVKSVLRVREEEKVYRFQTLIGTVKSHRPGAGHRGEFLVSNPHRYGQKMNSPPRWWTPELVSNPHRYGQKPHCADWLLSYYAAFQTLIGTVKRGGAIRLFPLEEGVSNPHRYGQKPHG